MVAESSIPTLTPQQSAALEAFLEPGANLAEIARKLGIGTVELVALLTSEPVAAALDVIRRVQQMQLDMAQSTAFAAATDALSKLLPKVQDAVEVRRTATAILRSIRPARARTIMHRPASRVPRDSVADSAPTAPRTQHPAPSAPRPPVRVDTGAPTSAPSTPRHVDTWTPSSTTGPLVHSTTSAATRLAAAAGAPGPAP